MGRPLVYLVALCLALTSARASELQRGEWGGRHCVLGGAGRPGSRSREWGWSPSALPVGCPAASSPADAGGQVLASSHRALESDHLAGGAVQGLLQVETSELGVVRELGGAGMSGGAGWGTPQAQASGARPRAPSSGVTSSRAGWEQDEDTSVPARWVARSGRGPSCRRTPLALR